MSDSISSCCPLLSLVSETSHTRRGIKGRGDGKEGSEGELDEASVPTGRQSSQMHRVRPCILKIAYPSFSSVQCICVCVCAPSLGSRLANSGHAFLFSLCPAAFLPHSPPLHSRCICITFPSTLVLYACIHFPLYISLCTCARVS